jgi:hypothetical protein
MVSYHETFGSQEKDEFCGAILFVSLIELFGQTNK